MSAAWLMLVFEEVPGYTAAKSGKSWWKRFGTREEAISEKRSLVAQDIRYVCKKADDKPQKSWPRHRNGLDNRKKSGPYRGSLYR